MSVHWVVVADAAGAAIYEGDVMLEGLGLVEAMGTHTRGGLPSAGASAGMAHHDPHIVREERFARGVASLVNEADRRHGFERLVLVAPPHFLGDLRAEISTTAAKRLVGSIHHDWTKVHPHELAARVRKELPEVFGLDAPR